MSRKDDSESDIWEYKPLEKKKKRQIAPAAVAPVARRGRSFGNKNPGRDAAVPARARGKTGKAARTAAAASGDVSSVILPERHISLQAHALTSKLPPAHDTPQKEGPSSGDFCPMCQMPFAILVVQSQRWHVAECLETPRDTCKECPAGLQCSSTIPNHYKKFNHTLLAHGRANSDIAFLSLPQEAETSGETGLCCLSESSNDKLDKSAFESSQDSTFSQSVSSPCNNITGTPPFKLTNGLMFLRSPGPEDFKKKKGWSSSAKGHRVVSASQESKSELQFTPLNKGGGEQDCEDVPKTEPSLENHLISYSPLSELPTQSEVNGSECKKRLFNSDRLENEADDSIVLFNDGFSSEDEVLTEFIDNLETNNVPEKDSSPSNTQLPSVTSLAPTRHLAAATVGKNRADATGEKEAHVKFTNSISQSNIQSPESVVLEHLRERLLTSDSLHFNHHSSEAEHPHTDPRHEHSSQIPTVQRAQTMAPQKGQSKAGQASSLKQTDIGVFFGLEPLKEKEKENEADSAPSALDTNSMPTLGENSGKRRQRKAQTRKSKADTTTDTSQGTEPVDGSNAVNARGEQKRGWTRGWRQRRNRVNVDGEVQCPRCPFYKKIPGTKFVIDAFHYGEIEGITAYFLTHFHSDHYGGLTKSSTFPIYCNRITGNLVKSKLKVAEKYVHILPMNTQVTVEGIRVILLDANHCPGAAMLLFFLPDGQTVLHTGDFRADPSMESYPELLSCRVQTLYLDTTYCSPEYTFPRQQEVINFAASTAFELVTLNPRTLVVCGSYSVGKEKVFLALADVLGSKVCLSRDKYNTMCCLESEQVRQHITTDWKAAQVHVLPMMQLSFKKLQDHLARFSERYDQLLAFKPTGWTFSQQVDSVGDIQPEISGNISIYGIPYSEHSSFLELKRFVQWVQPVKIIPTVNNGSWTNRKAMERYFSDWLMETKAKL